jgi:hypothetical protein
MLKIGTFLWIILTILLIGLPIVLVLFFASKRFQSVFVGLIAKIRHMTILKRFKQDILFRKKRVMPNISSDAEIRIDEVVAVVEEDNGVVVIEDREEIDIVQNIVQAPSVDSPIPEQDDIIVDKESFLKNKKQLEKIIYEALVLRKEGKLDEYEKKLIE